jgi:hypothetical protein
MVGRGGNVVQWQVYPSGERQRTARLDALRRRLSAGCKLDTSLWKDVIAGLPPG